MASVKKKCPHCGQQFELQTDPLLKGKLLVPEHDDRVSERSFPLRCPGSHQPAQDAGDESSPGKDVKPNEK